MSQVHPDPRLLQRLVEARMPFGAYRDVPLLELPSAYLAWWQRQGWPRGELGVLLATAFEIREAGLEYLLAPLRPASARSGLRG